jgi:hypothetical protein
MKILSIYWISWKNVRKETSAGVASHFKHQATVPLDVAPCSRLVDVSEVLTASVIRAMIHLYTRHRENLISFL